MASDPLNDVSTEELLKRHRSIQDRIFEEDEVPEERTSFAELVNPETRDQAEQLEKEMDRRGVKYRKIQW